MADLETILNSALVKEFKGETVSSDTFREGIPMKSSVFVDGKALVVDQFINGFDLTGGQEIVRVGNQLYTRLYGGGVINEIEREKLGIHKEQIEKFLQEILSEFGESTRLHEPLTINKPDGNWEYRYKPTGKNPVLPISTGIEEIFYKGHLVFVHNFIFLPIES